MREAILAVSFGTTVDQARSRDLGGVEQALSAAAPELPCHVESSLVNTVGVLNEQLLEQTIAYDEGTEVGETACQTLNTIVGTALSEAQIESLVIAKGYDDCVTYINDGVVCVAVSAPADGLSDADAALISDIVTSQTDYSLSQVRIIEVKP